MENYIEILSQIVSHPVAQEYIDYIKATALKPKTTKKETLYEKHHILPRSLFPEYDKVKSNIVKLTPYDHYMAHYIIAKSRNSKMLYAFNMMSRVRDPSILTKPQLVEAALAYQELKADFIEVVRKDSFNRLGWSDASRAKISKAHKGKLPVVVLETGLSTKISKEEYYSNPDKYLHHMTGRKHSTKTKAKMSENGIAGKVAFHHKVTQQVVFEDPSFSSDDYTKGWNQSLSTMVKERFKDSKHWTNIKTGQSFRSIESPGEDWIQKRSNFKNAFQGKSMLIDIRTGDKVLIDIESKTKFHQVHTKTLIETESKIFTSPSKFMKYLGVELLDWEVLGFLRNKPSSKKVLAKMNGVQIPKYSIENPKTLKYPTTKQIC